MADPVAFDPAHQCQCRHCGKYMHSSGVLFQIIPAPQPPPCEHEWAGVSVWQSSSGTHGSRRCIKCALYQQW